MDEVVPCRLLLKNLLGFEDELLDDDKAEVVGLGRLTFLPR